MFATSVAMWANSHGQWTWQVAMTWLYQLPWRLANQDKLTATRDHTAVITCSGDNNKKLRS